MTFVKGAPGQAGGGNYTPGQHPKGSSHAPLRGITLPTEVPTDRDVLMEEQARLIADEGLSPKEAAVCVYRAAGHSYNAIAAEDGTPDRRTVTKILSRNRDQVNLTQQRLRLRALALVEPQLEPMLQDLIDQAQRLVTDPETGEKRQDPQARNAPQAGRVVGELTGMIGKNFTHIGDVHHTEQTVEIDARTVNVEPAATPEELERRLAEARAKLTA